MSLPTLVQSAKAGSSTTVTSLTIAVSAVTLGNLLVVGEAHGSNTSSLGGPSGWTKAVENLPAGVDATGGSSIWYLIVDSGNAGATSFTFTSSTAHTILLGFEEWSSTNGWNTSPLDATATGENEGSPTQHTSIASGTTATTSQATELWFATTVYKSTSQTESGLTSGWTESQEITTSSTYTANIFHEAVSSTGAAGMSYTIGSAAYCAGCVATFKPIVATGEAFVGKATGVATATASLTGTKLTGIALGVASAVAMLTQPPVVAIAPPPFSPIGARYLVRARDMNNNAIDPITTYQRLDLVERFNATSDWSIQLDADDPVAALLVIPGYGITVTRTTYNLITGKVINSRVEMSGPMTGISREMSNNLLIVHGRDDMLSLTRRDAWPTTNFNFGSDVLAFTPAPTLYWRMDATSGTSETDRTGHSNTGTYGTIGTGSYHLNQGSLIDDPDASAAFTGTVGSSTTGAYLKLGSPSPTSVTGSYTVFLVANNGALGSVCGSRGSGDSSFDIQLQSTAPFIHGDIGTGSAWLTTSADSDASVVLPTVGPYIIC